MNDTNTQTLQDFIKDAEFSGLAGSGQQEFLQRKAREYFNSFLDTMILLALSQNIDKETLRQTLLNDYANDHKYFEERYAFWIDHWQQTQNNLKNLIDKP